MPDQKLLAGSHAPFWHDGSRISLRSYHIMGAAAPAVLMGIYQYGLPAFRVVLFSMSCAMLWELLMNRMMKRPSSIGDGNAALIGLLMAMLLPATTPWWFVVAGTFVAIVVGKQIYGGIGCNPLNPVLVAVAIVALSWKGLLDFNETLVNYDPGFYMLYPLSAVKSFGASGAQDFSLSAMFMGRQSGALGATFGFGLLIGGIYLLLRGYIRWEISLSFLVGLFVTASLFHLASPDKYAGPMFHLLTGYTLVGAFFLVTEDSSSPVNLIPMLIYGAGAGVMTILIRNLGVFVDGVVFGILVMNISNPLLDKIRPKALGKEVAHA